MDHALNGEKKKKKEIRKDTLKNQIQANLGIRSRLESHEHATTTLSY